LYFGDVEFWFFLRAKTISLSGFTSIFLHSGPPVKIIGVQCGEEVKAGHLLPGGED
jgi:hypothetical protein